MRRILLASSCLAFGVVLASVALAGQGPGEEPASTGGGAPGLGRPVLTASEQDQARWRSRPSSNGVILGRPISGRGSNPVSQPDLHPASGAAQLGEPVAKQDLPTEPVRQATFDNSLAAAPPSLAPIPEPGGRVSAPSSPSEKPPARIENPSSEEEPEVLRHAPRPVVRAKKPAASAKPAAFQSPAPSGPERLPPAVQEPVELVPGMPAPADQEAMPDMGCDGGCCGWSDFPAGMRGPLGQWWVSAEYLRWKVRAMHTPPLVTAGPAADPRAGILGDPATRVLFGGEISNNWQNGFRVGIGYWFDETQALGVEGSFLYLVPQITKFSAGPMAGVFIGRPFFDVAPGLAGEAAEEVNGPDLSGSVQVKLSTKLIGAEVNLRANLWADLLPGGFSYHVDGLAGFRFLQLQESLAIFENLVLLVPAGVLNPGDAISVMDQFKTRNSFYGGQIGIDSELRWGRWFLDLRAKAAFGVTHQLVTIDGQTMFFQPAGNLVSSQPGGLLALPTNMGSHTRTVFSVVPELGLNLGYQLTDHLRLFAGYTVIYWSHVARPGEQIDRMINSNQLPTVAGPGGLGGGPARPMLSIRDTSFWVQGVNLGAEFIW